MKTKINIANLRMFFIIAFFLVIGLLISFKFTNKKDVKKQDIIADEQLIKDKDTMFVMKHFEMPFFSDEGKLIYKLVSEYAKYSPTTEKRLYTLENILPETVFFYSTGGEYHLSANEI